jgi:hypothetical protein
VRRLAPLILLIAAPAAAQQGSVDVRSEPRGAAVALDGAARGPTPLVVEAAPGTHVLTLTLEGYVGERQTVTVTRGRTKVYVRLARAGAGRLEIRDEPDPEPRAGLGLVVVVTEPPGLTVIMNDQKVERPTPVAFDAAPGAYTTVVQYRGVELLATRTVVEAGWKVRVRRNLTKEVRAADRAAPRAGAAPERCGCTPPVRLKACVEKQRVCTFHRGERGAGYAICTRCPKFRRLSRRQQAREAPACDTREGRAADCVCADIGRVLGHCLEPQETCLSRCGR